MTGVIAAAAFVVGAIIAPLIVRHFDRHAALSLKKEAEDALAISKREAEALVAEAKRDAEHLVKEAKVAAKEEHFQKREALEKEAAEVRGELKERERRLGKREEALDEKLYGIERREAQVHAGEAGLAAKEAAVAERLKSAQELEARQTDELARIAQLGKEKAVELLLKRVEREVEQEQGEVCMRVKERLKEELDKEAREILTTAIQRVASDHAADVTVSTVDLPSEELKGRIIGREGRNIRAFERATGTDVIVDDTPGVIVLSAFDGVRRETARRAMEKLIADGRIHPTRIEELVAETIEEMGKHVQEVGKAAAVECGLDEVPAKLVQLLGRLKYRTSYGQNVLRHSVEVAQLCGTLAAELGLDVKLAKRCGLLHDIGKAVDHEQEGGHPEIGADLARRYEERAEVVNAIASHHNGCPQESLYAFVVMAADAVSGGRPGARGESLERYIHRLAKLEEVATQFPGVRQAYAIQAGREVRVIVHSAKVNDKQAQKLARDIAKQIEAELTYPGEIKVTLMRETRVTEYAR